MAPRASQPEACESFHKALSRQHRKSCLRNPVRACTLISCLCNPMKSCCCSHWGFRSQFSPPSLWQQQYWPYCLCSLSSSSSATLAKPARAAVAKMKRDSQTLVVNRSVFLGQEEHEQDAAAPAGKRRRWQLHRKGCSYPVNPGAKVQTQLLNLQFWALPRLKGRSEIWRVIWNQHLLDNLTSYFCISEVICSYMMHPDFIMLWKS